MNNEAGITTTINEKAEPANDADIKIYITGKADDSNQSVSQKKVNRTQSLNLQAIKEIVTNIRRELKARTNVKKKEVFCTTPNKEPITIMWNDQYYPYTDTTQSLQNRYNQHFTLLAARDNKVKSEAEEVQLKPANDGNDHGHKL